MPETSVHKDDLPSMPEREIRSAGKIPSMQAESIAKSEQHFSYSELGL
jgi:hypothetical protein